MGLLLVRLGISISLTGKDNSFRIAIALIAHSLIRLFPETPHNGKYHTIKLYPLNFGSTTSTNIYPSIYLI